MSAAEPLPETHPALIAAQRNIAVATDALHAIEAEALRIYPYVDRREIARPDAVDALMQAGIRRGCGRADVEHIVGEALSGRAAGVGYVPPPANNTTGARDAPTNARLRPLNIAEFLRLEIPPRRHILAPWLSEKSVGMVYSPRGVGKTMLGLSIGYAVASASKLLDWEASEPRRVLYVDGEMPAATMKQRLATIVAGFDNVPPVPEFFRMLSADVSENGLPDLATRDGQRILDECVGDAELIIADNISTLCRSGKENEAESWAIVQEWALAHRRAGRSVLFKHHAGKGGAQRGTSKREDVLDTVIALRRPVDYLPYQGARFEIQFEKARGFHGPAAEPFEAKYEVRHGAAMWMRTAITDAELTRVADAIRDGLSVREAAKELGMHRSKVERLKKRAAEKGMLDAPEE